MLTSRARDLRRSGLSRTVVVLGCVSFLNDAASEMVTPLLPVFLTAILGAGPALVGLIEGLAEAFASLLKLFSGWAIDRGWGTKKLILGGYSLSNAARPILGLATAWSGAIALRLLDRIGKGIRTAPRDVMIAAATEPHARGRAYGFHRSMDHAGAVIGPLIAFALLTAGADLREVFLASVIPGAAVILLIVLGLPPDRAAPVQAEPVRLVWRSLVPHVRSMVLTAGMLAFAAIPEVLVVLWATENGLAVQWVPLLWAVASLVKMGTAFPAGMLADALGLRPTFTIGMTLRISSLLLLAFVEANGGWIWTLFILYAFSLAITEPVERSLISNHAPPEQRGTAFGYYHLASSLFVLPGAAFTGWLWQSWSPDVAFASAAIVTALGAAVFLKLIAGSERVAGPY